MATDPQPDFTFLYDASKTLLGYFVHTCFKNYLDVVLGNLERWHEQGIIENLFQPTDLAARRAVFDFEALNMERIVFINGVYFYLLACHKAVNHRLMHPFNGKQVLYLRGFDFEGSLATGGGWAMGFASVDEQRFNAALAAQLCPQFAVFKAFSPKDVYMETIGLDRYFYGDFEALTRVAQRAFLSFYVNAARWKEGVAHFFDRCDHFLVYVDSITESALWELEQLDTDDRRHRVTVVFDEEGIKNKDLQLGAQQKLHENFGDQMIWSRPAPLPHQTAAELRKHLEQRFFVTTPEDFQKDIDHHRQRIVADSATLSPGTRETWLDFEFHPALNDQKLQQIAEFSTALQNYLTARTAEKGIDCLPLFLNNVQLRVFLTLLMGNHHETGLALAAYSAVAQATLNYYRQPGSLPEEKRELHLNLLDSHQNMAQHISLHLLSFGKSHEFANISKQASADFKAIFDATLAAAQSVFHPPSN